MGVTLSELMAVMFVIGILVVLAVPQYIRTAESTRAEEAVVSLQQIRHGEIVYRGAENSYWPLGATQNSIATINTQLNLTLDGRAERNWNYSVTAPTALTFTATATRTRGRNTGETITISESGDIDDAGWTP